jgi:Fe-S cluster assembly iron-binding protein IscA
LGLALDEPNDNNETVTIINGLEVIIDDQVAPYIAEQVVDYIDSRLGKGFVIRRASGAAGC